MHILVLHNRYAQHGGEDVVVEAEADLLRRHGHEVRLLSRNNRSITPWTWLGTAWNSTWNEEAYRVVADQLREQAFDVAHVHNFFPLFSPSVFAACREAGVAVVHTLHNFRTICAAATLTRPGGQCQKCVRGSAYWAVCHACYRESRLASLPVARMIDVHRRRGTWSTLVNRFIAPSESVREIFVAAGFPRGRVVVKPHFAGCRHEAGREGSADGARAGALFVGRLSAEKGILMLLDAWRQPGLPPLTVLGNGPLANTVRQRQSDGVLFLGWRPPKEVATWMGRAQFLVMPSRWPETFGLVIIEAFRCGLPVIASRIGAMAEIVQNGVTGLLVEPGDVGDLLVKVRWAQDNPAVLARMGETAREVYKQRYTPEHNYRRLEEIYLDAIAARRRLAGR